MEHQVNDFMGCDYNISCLSRWLSLVCKIPIMLFGLQETNTIGC
jgi:hypothetical protein